VRERVKVVNQSRAEKEPRKRKMKKEKIDEKTRCEQRVFEASQLEKQDMVVCGVPNHLHIEKTQKNKGSGKRFLFTPNSPPLLHHIAHRMLNRIAYCVFSSLSCSRALFPFSPCVQMTSEKKSSSSSSSSSEELVTPGHFLGLEKEYQSGEGTYALEGKIYSSLVGERKITKKDGQKVCSGFFFPPPNTVSFSLLCFFHILSQ
jgi:hypothetical protein